MSEDCDSSELLVKNYNERVKHIKKYNPEELRMNFLKVLLENNEALYSLVEAANFYANMHSIHDGCPSGDRQCDYCYSGDTEFDTKYGLQETLKKLWLDAYKMTPIEDSDSEDDSHSNSV